MKFFKNFDRCPCGGVFCGLISKISGNFVFQHNCCNCCGTTLFDANERAKKEPPIFTSQGWVWPQKVDPVEPRAVPFQKVSIQNETALEASDKRDAEAASLTMEFSNLACLTPEELDEKLSFAKNFSDVGNFEAAFSHESALGKPQNCRCVILPKESPPSRQPDSFRWDAVRMAVPSSHMRKPKSEDAVSIHRAIANHTPLMADHRLGWRGGDA